MVFKTTIPLSAQIREVLGKKSKDLRQKELLPAVIYGQKTKNLPLVLDFKEFEKVLREVGEHTLIGLKIKGQKGELPVLIHDIQKHPLTGKVIHVDFYKPDLEKKVKTLVPLRIEGGLAAIRNLGGTLIKNFSELEIRALPINIPHEIVVNADSLDTLGSEIFIKDLNVPEGVEILKDPNEVVVLVAAPTKVEEELEKPIEEKVEEVEEVKEKEEEVVKEEEKAKPAAKEEIKKEQ